VNVFIAQLFVSRGLKTLKYMFVMVSERVWPAISGEARILLTLM
jgi:hypothetical protein